MKKFFPLVITILLTSGCQSRSSRRHNTSSSNTTTSSVTQETSQSEEYPTKTQATSITPTTSVIPVTSISSKETTVSTSIPTSSFTGTSTMPSDSLPNGYIFFDAPKNTPIEIVTSETSSDWWNNTMIDDFPNDDWSYLNGTSYHTLPKFYENDIGGLKFDYKKKGFQTPMFHHNGPKLEINIKISQYIEATGGKPDKSTSTAYLFFYDKNGTYLNELTYELPKETMGPGFNQIHRYVTGSQTKDVAYFEFRLNNLPYKGNTVYNFGISEVNVHSWAWEN